MEENKQGNVQLGNRKDYSALITVVVIIILGIIIWNALGGLFFNNETNSKTHGNKPSNLEIMSYAQTVLDKELFSPSYSKKENDYTIIETGLRYKIKGKVNSENFNMIIEFLDNTYEEYDLISLQVGNKKY